MAQPMTSETGTNKWSHGIRTDVSRMLRHSSGSQNQQIVRMGFSLFELLLVVGILAGLIGFSAPALLKWQDQLQRDRAIRAIQSLCADARLTAIQLEQPIEVVLVNENTLRPRHPEETSASTKSIRLPDGYSVRSIGNVREPKRGTKPALSAIRFFPDGTAEPLTLTLSDQHRKRQADLRINPLTGALTVQAGPQ